MNALTQAEHDARHPGKICGNCPIEVEHRALLTEPRPRMNVIQVILAAIVLEALVALAIVWVL
jgi:hypothetical protein